MNASTLFDGMARAGDPATSKAAALSMLPHRRSMQEAIYAALARYGPMTPYELKAATGLESEQNSIAKRCSELHDDGRIEPSGQTRPGRTGRPLTVWRVAA